MRFITSITLFAAGLLGASALAIFNNNTCCNIYWDDQKPEGERNPVRPLIWCDPAVDYAATCPKPTTETEPKVGSDSNIDTSTDPSNDTCCNIYWDDQKPEGERNPARPRIFCDPNIDYATTCPKPATETDPVIETNAGNGTCTNPPCQSTDRDYRQTRQRERTNTRNSNWFAGSTEAEVPPVLS